MEKRHNSPALSLAAAASPHRHGSRLPLACNPARALTSPLVLSTPAPSTFPPTVRPYITHSTAVSLVQTSCAIRASLSHERRDLALEGKDARLCCSGISPETDAAHGPQATPPVVSLPSDSTLLYTCIYTHTHSHTHTLIQRERDRDAASCGREEREIASPRQLTDGGLSERRHSLRRTDRLFLARPGLYIIYILYALVVYTYTLASATTRLRSTTFAR